MMKRKKVYKNGAIPGINSLAYLSHDKKKKKPLRDSELSYLSTWSMMKWKKVYKNDAWPRINPLAYLPNNELKKMP